MNFLELGQFVGRYMQAGNEKPGTYPATMVGQVDLNFEIVKGLQDAYRDILTEQTTWAYMRQQGTLSLSLAQRVLTLAQIVAQIPTYRELVPFVAGFGNRFINSYPTIKGNTHQGPCFYVLYENWRGIVDQTAVQPGKAQMFTVRPDRAIEFSAGADQAYSFSIDYRIETPTLSADADVPIGPADWHEAIAWRALKYWAMTRKAGEDYQLFDREYQRVMQRMKNDQLPETWIPVDQFWS